LGEPLDSLSEFVHCTKGPISPRPERLFHFLKDRAASSSIGGCQAGRTDCEQHPGGPWQDWKFPLSHGLVCSLRPGNATCDHSASMHPNFVVPQGPQPSAISRGDWCVFTLSTVAQAPTTTTNGCGKEEASRFSTPDRWARHLGLRTDNAP
jgi:hypothetical protein